MTLVLRVYCGNEIKELEVEQNHEYTIGNLKDNSVCIDNLKCGKKAFHLYTYTEGWSIKQDNKKIGKSDNGLEIIPFEKPVVLDNENRIAVSVYKSGPDYSHTINISQEDEIIIGRSGDCNISLNSNQISSKHLLLKRQGGAWTFQDLGSSNGTYHNYKIVKSGVLHQDDVLNIGYCRIILLDNTMTVIFPGLVSINIGVKRNEKSVDSITDPYPYLFKQSPRLREELPSEVIEIQSPPSIGGKPEVSWLNILLQPVLTVVVMLGICFFVTGAKTMLYFSVPMTAIGALMSVVRYKSEIKKYKNTEHLRIDKYSEYMDDQVKNIEHLIKEQKRILNNENPATLQCLHLAAGPERTLWNRRYRDMDFMTLRIGSGTVPTTISIKAPKQMLSLEVDTLSLQPNEVADKYAEVEGCPITVDLGSHPTCGIIGDRSKCVTLGKNMIVQAATHHSYEDLRVVVLCDSDEREEWLFCKWLPHIFDDTRSVRYFADTPQQGKKLLDQLQDILSQREVELNSSEYNKSYNNKPYYLFICASEYVTRHSVMKYLRSNNHELGVGAIFLFNRLDDLPKECHHIIEFGLNGAVAYEKDNASQKRRFATDSMPLEAYDTFARYLAPIKMDYEKSGSGLPTTISYMQGYGAKTPQMLDIESNWNNSHPESGMSVPIGIRDSGEPFYFDIHEKQHGPHGVVAGMTGSGKSEMVQSWILSMATKFSPETVSFVLIDFKGTGLILPFKNLPHLAGTISDLDKSIGRNLIALENELMRRKALLDKHQVSNISAYRKLLRQGIATETFPYLFVIIDEFAEFKIKFPEFMKAVNSIFATGRTLGVHIILLTQKPANVVDDKMNANTRFRWCLKVANSADSREMLRHPDAAKITNPGRAFVQVGEDEVFEQVQSYWSGAPYNPYNDLKMQRANKVSVVDLYGNRICYEQEKTTGYRSEKSEIDAVVEYLDEFARKNNISRAKAIWTTKLPTQLYLKDILQVAFDGEKWNADERILKPMVGLIDDPRSQSQYPLYLNFAEDGHTAIFGAPGSGKTTFLHTAIMSMALSYTPENINMYLLDFGGGSLNIFRHLPHVGDIAVGGQDDDKINRIADLLLNELDNRKKLLASYGLINISSLYEASGIKLPNIVIILDNFAPVLEMYPQLDLFFQKIVRDGAGFGIYFVVTAGTYNALTYRISQNIKSMIALRMTDKNDYSVIVGRTEGLEPEGYVGRGLIRENPPLEIQVALPAEGKNEVQRVDNLRNLVQLMQSKWTGKKAQAIPVVPEVVCSSDYNCEDVLLGISFNEVVPLEFNMAKEQFLMISSMQRNKEPFYAIAKQILHRTDPSQVVGFGDVSTLGIKGLKGNEFDLEIEKLMPVLQHRKEQYMANGLLSKEEYPYITIVINDLKECFDMVNDDTIRRLTSIVTLGKGLNIVVLVDGNTKEIEKLYHGGDSFTMNLVRHSTVLLIGGSVQSHSMVTTDLPYSVVSVTMADCEAYLVRDNSVEKIKVVCS